MNASRAPYLVLSVAVLWIAAAVIVTDRHVDGWVAITGLASALLATAALSWWAGGGDRAQGSAPAMPALPAVPAQRASSNLSIASPVVVVDDGGQDRVLNCFESAGIDRDWDLDSIFEDESDGDAVPPEIDLRAAWWDVADQGSTGSCVGWACADSVLRWQFTDAGKLPPGERLSARYVWMASKETDRFTSRPTAFLDRSGTSIKAAVDIARRYGVAHERDLGFRSQETSSLRADAFYARAAEFRVGSYINLIPAQRRNNLGASDALQRAWWRYWLSTHGPILTRLDVDQSFRARDSDTLTNYAREGSAGHAVAIVGYDETGFIVRNSWGERWGDGGYKHASFEYAAAAFTDAYGVRL